MEEATRHALSASVELFAAYIFIRLSYYRRYSCEHLRTDRFALHLLGYAAGFAVLGAAIAHTVPDVLPHWTPKRLQGISGDVDFVGITPITVNAIISALILAYLDNIRVRFMMRHDAAVLGVPKKARMRMAAVSLYIRESNDSMLRTLFRAQILQKNVMFTLKNHKVYVGWPLFQPDSDPTKPMTSIRIFPVASGVRGTLTKRVTLSTRYSDIFDALTEIPGNEQDPDRSDPFATSKFSLAIHKDETREIDLEDIGIVIAWNQLHSMTLFDENIFEWFQSISHPRKRESPRQRISHGFIDGRQCERGISAGIAAKDGESARDDQSV